MNDNLNPVETTVELQPTVDHEVGSNMIAAEIAETYSVSTSPIHAVEGEIPALDNLTDEQKNQLKELQKRMELYNQSRSGHREGDTHKFSDGVSYLVSKSGAYNRIGAPRKSRKAQHRKEVAARRAGKS